MRQGLVKYKCDYELKKGSIQATGFDLHYTGEAISLRPFNRVCLQTSLYLDLPIDIEGQVRPRSGVSLKTGLVVILGSIDSDYTGEVGIIVVNTSCETITIEKGMKIAQIVFKEKMIAVLSRQQSLDKVTERGSNGFGSTGI